MLWTMLCIFVGIFLGQELVLPSVKLYSVVAFSKMQEKYNEYKRLQEEQGNQVMPFLKYLKFKWE